MKKAYHLILADLHSGHKFGLCNPETIMYDEDSNGNRAARYPKLGPFQSELWNDLMVVKGRVEAIVHDDPVIITCAGDITQGIRFMESLMSTEIDDHIEIAFYALLPWFESPMNVIAARLIHGTGVHSFGGHAENSVARELQASFPNVDIATTSHSLLNISGKTFNIAHHGPTPGSRNWLKGRELLYYVQSLVGDCLDADEVPPDFVARAHYHEWVPPITYRKYHSGKLYETTGILLPSLCGITNHGRQATKSKTSITVGVMLIEVSDDGHTVMYGPESGLIATYNLLAEEKMTW